MRALLKPLELLNNKKYHTEQPSVCNNQPKTIRMKTKCYSLISLLLVLTIISCNGQTNNNGTSKESKSKTTASNYKEGQDYLEFKRARILDKVGFTKPIEAYSVLIPNKWSFESDIMWNAPGTICAGNNISVKTTSPDGKYSFELLPNYMWAYITDPQLAQFSQQQQYPKYCFYGEPMNATNFIKNKIIPNELSNAKLLDIKDNPKGQQLLHASAEKNRQRMMQYGGQSNNYTTCATATVQLSASQEALVLCGVIINENVVANNYNGTYTTNYVTTATQRMIFKYPKGEKEKATNMLGVIMASFRTNTDWQNIVNNFWNNVSQQSYQAHLGKLKMMDAQTQQMGREAIKKGQQNLDNMDANMRSWEAKQASQDRMHTNFIKTIREVENYSDATGKVELSSGYNHAWSRGDGSSFIMTDNPNFDPSSVFQDQQWKEMKQVD